jgi:hypothetical protein
MFTPSKCEPIDLFTAEPLTVSGGATPSKTSDPTYTGLLSRLYVFVANAGLSTSATIKIKGKPNKTSLLNSDLAVFTLGEGTDSEPCTAGKYIENFPDYVYAVIINNDAVAGHTASVTVTLTRTR